ncbi:MAG: hypothetical protein PHQ65_07955 [Bacteroidales bacterium]|nr:hypothetical protein [Bacteroidales bacterium]MDD3665184.1 hypothetical protein [Bacteroidales bacterium]
MSDLTKRDVWFSRLILMVVHAVFMHSYVFSQVVTNEGTDFWVAFVNSPTTNDEVRIFISSSTETTGSISSSIPGVNQSFTVSPGVMTEITLPQSVRLSGGVENKGVRVTSLAPVVVYPFCLRYGTSGGYLAIPVEALGTDYLILTEETVQNQFGSGFVVVAPQDGTILTIFDKQNNNTTTVNLESGQAFYMKDPGAGKDMTGSRVQSNLPVAVLGTVGLGCIPDAFCGQSDLIIEQLPPVTAWGKNFVMVPFAGRPVIGDQYRVLAATDSTFVSIDGAVADTLDEGEYYGGLITQGLSITASHPVLVGQYSKGCVCASPPPEPDIGDPAFVVISPREQFLCNYTIGSATGFTQSWVNLVATTNALGTIYEDGVLIPLSEFSQIGTTGFWGAQREVTTGSHVYSAVAPFGVFVYGWNVANAYAYAGGCSMSPVATVTSISLSPATSTGILAVTSVCLTAHVVNTNNQPVAGVLVDFFASGLGPLSGSAYTNASGDAVWCYTREGSNAGTDQIIAVVSGVNSNAVEVSWSPCDNPSSGGQIGFPQSGCFGFDPQPLLSVALPMGGTGSVYEYQWQLSTISSSTGFVDIPGANNESFDPAAVGQTTWFCRLAKTPCNSNWVEAAPSNIVEITANGPAPNPIKHE